MSNLDDRAARAKRELEMAFEDSEMPPATTIRSRHRRGRTMQASIIGLTAVVAAVGLAYAVRDDSSNDEGIVIDDNTSTTTATTSETTTTTAVVAPAVPEPTEEPEVLRMVAATSDGRIVVLAADGSIERELAVVHDEGGYVGDIQVLGDDVYYTAFPPPDEDPFTFECAALWRVPFAGGAPEQTEYTTNTFAFSPDGTRVALSSCPNVGADAKVDIVDVTTGETHTWRLPTPEESPDEYEYYLQLTSPGEMAWTPDGQSLAVEWCYEECENSIVDPNRDGVYSIDDQDAGASSPTFVDGSLWTIAANSENHAESELMRIKMPVGVEPAAERLFPFTPGAWYLEAGAGSSLVGYGNENYEGDLFIEIWTIGGDVQRLSAVDATIERLATG